MALFGAALVEQVTDLLRQHHAALGIALGHAEQPAEQHAETPLGHDLRLLIQVANGELARTDAAVLCVEAALQAVLGLLSGTALGARGPLPDTFWHSELGIVVSRARWWVSADDLITISNAAALAFGENTQASRMRIVRAIEREELNAIPDPSVANPQQNRRVLRSQVERLRDLRRLPTSDEGGASNDQPAERGTDRLP